MLLAAAQTETRFSVCVFYQSKPVHLKMCRVMLLILTITLFFGKQECYGGFSQKLSYVTQDIVTVSCISYVMHQ